MSSRAAPLRRSDRGTSAWRRQRDPSSPPRRSRLWRRYGHRSLGRRQGSSPVLALSGGSFGMTSVLSISANAQFCGTWHLALGTWHLALGTWHLALGT